MKIEKISNRVLLACIIVILVCFGAFMSIGYDNQVGEYNEPMLTDVIMWLMYVLFVVTAVLTIWSIARNARSSKGIDSAATTGVPSGKITMWTSVLTIVSLAAGLISGIGETEFVAKDGTVTSGAWVTAVDMFCVSMGVLLVAAAIAVAVSMSGIMTKK